MCVLFEGEKNEFTIMSLDFVYGNWNPGAVGVCAGSPPKKRGEAHKETRTIVSHQPPEMWIDFVSSGTV